MVLRRTIRPLLALLAFCSSIGMLKGQDPQFTQFYANKLYLNPAFAGTNQCPRAILGYRDQWPGLTGKGKQTLFRTISASYDQNFESISGGLGLLVTQDDAANHLSTTRASAIYSYRLEIKRTFNIRAGFQATWFQRKLDWSQLTFGDMIDPRKGFIYTTQNQPENSTVSGVDFSAGVLGHSEKYFFGAAVHHMTEPNEGFITDNSPLPMKITGHAGANISLVDSRFSSSEMTLSPNILFQQQGNFRQVNLGTYLKKGPIVGGLWYRNRDAFIALIGFQKGRFKFGYSYDVTISSLSGKTAGAHEVSLTINFDCPPDRQKYRTISCPSF